MDKIVSGASWVAWANLHAQNSQSVNDLADPFKTYALAFIQALENAGAKVEVTATRRDVRRAYLFHWCWKIGLGFSLPSAATVLVGVDIEWDHGDAADTEQGAKEMISGFGLAIPPRSNVAPALNSDHILGLAIDMNITWTGTMTIRAKDGTQVLVPFLPDVNKNLRLHAVGATYGVRKLVTDAPHWSIDGH